MTRRSFLSTFALGAANLYLPKLISTRWKRTPNLLATEVPLVECQFIEFKYYSILGFSFPSTWPYDRAKKEVAEFVESLIKPVE